MRSEKFHLSPHDGLYRKCQIRTQPCPFAIPDIEHKTIPELAANGGAKFTDGAGKKGTMQVTPVEANGFMVVGSQRRRAYEADGTPLYGKDKRSWLKQVSEKFLRKWGPPQRKRAAPPSRLVQGHRASR